MGEVISPERRDLLKASGRYDQGGETNSLRRGIPALGRSPLSGSVWKCDSIGVLSYISDSCSTACAAAACRRTRREEGIVDGARRERACVGYIVSTGDLLHDGLTSIAAYDDSDPPEL